MVGVPNGLSNLGTLREILDAPLAAAPSTDQTSSQSATSSPDSAGQAGTSGSKGHSGGTAKANSVATQPRITAIVPVGGAIIINFLGVAGSSYQIERTSSFESSGSWEDYGSFI